MGKNLKADFNKAKKYKFRVKHFNNFALKRLI